MTGHDSGDVGAGGCPRHAGTGVPSVGTQRRQRRHRETRQEIVAAASRIVIESGVEHLTVREIARRTDFTPSALYRYFEGGRPEILLAIVSSNLEVLEGHLARVSEDLPPTERIVAMGDAYLRFTHEHPREAGLLFDSVTAIEPEDMAKPAETFLAPTGVYRLLESALRDGIADGTFRIGEDDLVFVMHGTWALVHGLAVVEQLHQEHGGVFGGRGRELIRAFVNGLGSDWAGRSARAATP
jgi:AcrR family transcriptional regulator